MFKNNTNLMENKQKALNNRIKYAQGVRKLRAVQADTDKFNEARAKHWTHIIACGFTVALVGLMTVTIFIDPSKLKPVTDVFKLVTSVMPKL